MGRGRALCGVFLAMLSFAADRAMAGDLTHPATLPERLARIAAITDLGRRLFMDPALSASGAIACATCHAPRAAFSPGNADAVQRGGADGRVAGERAAPTLTYLASVTPFELHKVGGEDDGAKEGADLGPTGGLDWDGRAPRLKTAARDALYEASQMANAGPSQLAERLRGGAHAATLRNLFGDVVARDPLAAEDAVTEALESFLMDPPSVGRYDSRYDRFLAGQSALGEAEARGLAAFNDAERGNCAACHPSAVSPSGGHPDFTDFGFDAIAVPRNPEIPANANAGHIDLGLCGPARDDLRDHPETCGLFRTPSLRNVALKQRFFHNGYARTLRDAVAFHVTRDLDRRRWYGVGRDGQPDIFADLPAPYWANVSTQAPFAPAAEGRPRLSRAEIDDIVAFLRTLTDTSRQ